MSDYIERDAALKAVNRHYPDPNAMCAALVTVPAADVVARDCFDRLLAENDELRKVRPVMRGEWEQKEVFEANGHVEQLQSAFCPVCQRYHTTPYSYYFTHYNFCPNCGADMSNLQSPDGNANNSAINANKG